MPAPAAPNDHPNDARGFAEDSPAPSCNISASSTRVLVGDRATLTWNSSYASSASLDNGIGSVSTVGSQDVSPTATTTYTLTVTSALGSAMCTADIAVMPRPNIRIDTNVRGSLLKNGDTITNTITVRNGFAGKKIRLELVNHGAGQFSESLLDAARSAVTSVLGLSVTRSDGASVEFTLADGSYTIPITQTVALGDIWGTTDDARWATGYQLQADWIIQSSPTNGAPVDGTHNVVSRWITYALPAPSRSPAASDARWSILRSVPHIGTGDTVTFSIDKTIYPLAAYPLAASASVQIGVDSASTGSEADFTRTLNAAITSALTPGVSYSTSTNTLTFGTNATFPFTFTLTAGTTRTNKDFILRISNPSIGQIDVTKAGVRLGTLTMPAMTPVLGINEASGDFGDGTLDVDFTYAGNDRIDWVASEGFGIVRVPFRYRNVQAASTKPLDATRMAEIDRIVTECAAKHLICLLDMHNFGYYYNYATLFRESSPGTINSPNSAFADLWAQVAARYKNNPNVWFGLMNEPHDQSALEWVKTANAAAAAIRATGAMNKIIFQGSYWDGAWKWQSTDNHLQMLKAYDPGNNYAFDAHQYLDTDGSGTHSTCTVGSGATRLRPFTTWLQTHGLHGIIGEVGWAANPGCTAEATALLHSWVAATTSTSAGGYIALTYWAAGPWWTDSYMFIGEPRPFPAGSEPAQLTTLKNYLPR